MSSIFSTKGLLNRRSRIYSKHTLVSPSKAKPLDILPDLSEEFEDETPLPSTSSVSPQRDLVAPSRSSSEIKRNSRRVVLTGVEGLSLQDIIPFADAPPPRPTPAPSLYSKSESPLDDINLRFSGLGITIDFPSPPASSPSFRRDKSPTPSEASSRTSASESSTVSRNSASTPLTSDDELGNKPHISHCPTIKSHQSHRPSVFINSIPDLHPSPSSSASFIPEFEDDVDNDDSEDASWFAQDISDIITLGSSLPPSLLSTSTTTTMDPRARPDSLPPPPPKSEHVGKSRFSKPLPTPPRLTLQRIATTPCGPSSQLDPTYSTPYRRFVPSKPPPPPPPIRAEHCLSPTMEEKTDELLALLANAAMTTGFLGTGLRSVDEPATAPVTPRSIFAISPETPRPPPRSSIPADIVNDAMEDIGDDSSIFDLSYYQTMVDVAPLSTPVTPVTPTGFVVYSQASMGADASPLSPLPIPFDIQIGEADIPESPLAGMYPSHTLSLSTSLSITPPSPPPTFIPSVPVASSSSSRSQSIVTPQPNLRSRWSSSTISSDGSRQAHPVSASSWTLRFPFGNNNHHRNVSSISLLPKFKPTTTTTSKLVKKPSLPKMPLSPTSTRRFLDLDRVLAGTSLRESGRRESIDSVKSAGSDSEESTSSSGLKRKPIPVEIFLR